MPHLHDSHHQQQPSDPPLQHLSTGARRSLRFGKKQWFIAAGAAAVLLIGAVVAWFVMASKPHATAPSQQSQKTNANKQDEQPAIDPVEAAKPTTFKSEKLGIEFTHRADWQLVESPDKLIVTLTSPKVSGQTFTLRFSQGLSASAVKGLNATAAVKDSVVIAYDAPTDAQRYYTNVSYAGQDGKLQFFIITSSTALKTGDRLEDMFAVSEGSLAIVGGFGTDKNDTLGFTAVDVSRVDSVLFQQAIAVVQSLKIY